MSNNEAHCFHIMLVEDNPADVFLIERALKENSVRYKLDVFENGDEALKVIAQGESGVLPDLVVLDLHLPRTGGVDVLRSIRSTPRFAGIPIMILTSSQSPSDQHRVGILGATRYMQKPTLLDDFMNQVGGGIKELLLDSGKRGAGVE